MVRAGGRVLCGELRPSQSGEALTLSGTAISKVDEVTIVDSCPSAAAQNRGWWDSNALALRGALLTVGLLVATAIGWHFWGRFERDPNRTSRGSREFAPLVVGLALLGLLLAIGPGTLGGLEATGKVAIVLAACVAGLLGVGLHILLNRVLRSL